MNQIIEVPVVSQPVPIIITDSFSNNSNSNLINVPFAFGDASPTKLYTASANQLILTVSIIIITPFNGSNVILTVGDSANPSRLFSNSFVYSNEIGEYTSNPCYKYSTTTDINLYITLNGGNTTGMGHVIIEI